MDKATLVKSDLDIGVRILAALSQAKIPVTLYDWSYAPQLDDWKLIIATPWYDSKGPREAYTKVFAALQDADIYKESPLLRLSLKSPQDPLVKALERDVKTATEGVLHIATHSKLDDKRQYSVLFAPLANRSGVVPSKKVATIEELRELLEDHLRISKSSVDEALRELNYKGYASIFEVRLTNKEAKAFRLA